MLLDTGRRSATIPVAKALLNRGNIEIPNRRLRYADAPDSLRLKR